MLRDTCCIVCEQRMISRAQVMTIDILDPVLGFVSQLLNCNWISTSRAAVKSAKLCFVGTSASNLHIQWSDHEGCRCQIVGMWPNPQAGVQQSLQRAACCSPACNACATAGSGHVSMCSTTWRGHNGLCRAPEPAPPCAKRQAQRWRVNVISAVSGP